MSTSILVISTACAVAACADPASRLDDFSERVIDAGTDRPDAEILDDLPNPTGRHLLSLDPSPFPGTLFQFEATIELTRDEEGAPFLGVTLQPLNPNNMQPVGDPVTPDDNPVPVAMTGEFEIVFTDAILPGPANPVSGTELTADLAMDGIIRSNKFLCGTVDGGVTQPFTLSLDASSFGSLKVPEQAGGMTGVAPIASCAGDPGNDE